MGCRRFVSCSGKRDPDALSTKSRASLRWRRCSRKLHSCLVTLAACCCVVVAGCLMGTKPRRARMLCQQHVLPGLEIVSVHVCIICMYVLIPCPTRTLRVLSRHPTVISHLRRALSPHASPFRARPPSRPGTLSQLRPPRWFAHYRLLLLLLYAS